MCTPPPSYSATVWRQRHCAHILLGIAHILLGIAHILLGIAHILLGIAHILLGIAHILPGIAHILLGMYRIAAIFRTYLLFEKGVYEFFQACIAAIFRTCLHVRTYVRKGCVCVYACMHARTYVFVSPIM